MNRPEYLLNWLKRAHNGDIIDRQAAYYVEYLEDSITQLEAKNKALIMVNHTLALIKGREELTEEEKSSISMNVAYTTSLRS